MTRMGPRVVEWEDYARLGMEELGEDMGVEEMEGRIRACMVKNMLTVSKPAGGRKDVSVRMDEATWNRMVEADRGERPARAMIAEVTKWAERNWAERRSELEEDIREHRKRGFTITRARIEAGKTRWTHVDSRSGPLGL